MRVDDELFAVKRCVLRCYRDVVAMCERDEQDPLAADEVNGTLIVEQHAILLLLLEERHADGGGSGGLEEHDKVQLSFGAVEGVGVQHAEKEGEASVYG